MAKIFDLLHSTAFAPGNIGSQAMAAHKNTPDPSPLIATVDRMNDNATVTAKGDDLTKYAPDIGAMVDYWNQTDAIVEGYQAIKTGGETYLPKFPDEEADEYKVRLELTKFTNVYRDILEGLASKPFEEEISFSESEKTSNVPEQIKDFAENVDGAGNNMTVFGSQSFFNGINSAIDWIFVDYPTVDSKVVRTVADQKAAGIRPFWTHVLGRNVREVKTKIVNGNQVLSYIRIFEPGIGEPDRVRIFERADNGTVGWQLWEKLPTERTGEIKFQLIQGGVLSIDVIPLVPFATGRRDGTSWKFLPAMRDAADLQIKLYQAESALEFTTTMAGYPMLAANGFAPEIDPTTKKPKKLRIGPNRILWGKPDGNGNHGEWAYVEPSAQTLEFQQKKIEKTKEDLRELGRQPLTATSGNLTVITTAVAAGKARSAVSAWTLLLKDALENALVITCKWMNIRDYEPEVNVYNEFDNFTEAVKDIEALKNMRDSGDLSQETYWYEMKRRKVLSPEFNDKTERKRLLAEIPAEDDPDLEDDDVKPVDDKKPKQ